MRKNLTSELNRRIRIKKVLNFILLIVLPLILFFVVWESYDDSPQRIETVIGVVENRNTVLHNEGHTNYLYVRLTVKKKLIKVMLPKFASAKVGHKVLLNKYTKSSSKKSKYMFLKRIE